MEARDSFVFYRSFYEAVTLLRPKDRVEVILAICEYALNGKELDLSGIPEAVFKLVKPNLDANYRKYENGRKKGKGKSKTKANAEQTGSKTEPNADGDVNVNDNEDVNADGDGGGGGETPSPAAAVERAYRKQINPKPSASCLRELRRYAEQLGEACCLRAMDEALDAQKRSWSYIRAILQAKLDQGVRSLADWDALEEKRKKPAPYKSWAELAAEMDGAV